MNHSRTDLIEMETSDKKIQPNTPPNEESCVIDCKKVKSLICIAVSVITIILIWLAVLVPVAAIVVRIFQVDRSGRFPGQNLSTILPPINSTNSTNLTIINVDCIDNFIYVPGEEICYPDCQWSPYGPHATRITRILLIVLSVLGIVLGTATLIGWLLTSCVDWKKLRLHYDFQLARTSLFMVVLSSFIVILTNACIDILDRSVLFCKQTNAGESYLLPHQTYFVSDDPNIRIVVNLIGFVNNYFFLVNLCWIAFSVINILVLVFFPYLRERFRKRLLVFSFQFLFSFGINLILFVVPFAIAGDATFVSSYIGIFVILYNSWLFVLMFVFPSLLLPCFVISLVVIVLTKLRINSIKSLEVTGRAYKLTDLEKRLFCYSIILMIMLFLYGIVTILIAYFTSDYFQSIGEYVLCITVNSPILVQSNDTVYRENPYGGVDVCNEIKDTANKALPYFIPTLLAFYLRFLWMLIFIVLVPYISVRDIARSLKCSKIPK